MRRITAFFLFFFLLTGSLCAQQMSDEQVIEYVKRGQATGKSQQQMTTELLSRGVTKEQVERIKTKYEKQQQASATGKEGSSSTQNRLRTTNVKKEGFPGFKLGDEEDEYMTDIQPITADSVRMVFGHNIFKNPKLTFEPNLNMATPENYKLGPGDEVIIDVWGSSENTIREVISPEGSIQVSTLGPVYLSGMTVKEANRFLQGEFGKIYSGIQGNTSEVKLTLGQIRSILVNVFGEVAVPGTYRLSSFSSVFHALYNAGGVSPIGSLRNIAVVRNGKKIAEVDVYDYILKGKMNDDIRLMENDVILVSPYQNLVDIAGKVKRPMFYEMKRGETLDKLMDYAGGFTGDAYSKGVRLIRKSGREKQIYNVDAPDFVAFMLMDEDSVSVEAVLERYENMVEVKGAVYREGLYQVNDRVNSVAALIERAEGIRGDAFLNRAQLKRENEDLTWVMIPVDLQGILNGSASDIELQRNDVLYIPSIHDLKSQPTLTIEGEVMWPGEFDYADNMSIEDLVMMAGGLTEAASMARVDVARRIKNPNGTTASSKVGEMFSFEFKDGYLIGGDSDFVLQPYDQVYIRKSPSYQAQKNVAVGGEVLYPGKFAITQKNERLSSLVNKSGGVTQEAYVKGARLIRRMTPEEMKRRDDVKKLTDRSAGSDSISADKLDMNDFYTVGIDLEQALANPNSAADMVLREGDILYIPEYVSTVRINGTVMYPNTVAFKPGEKLGYYINQAGGYGYRAKKSKAYIVYLNGTVSRAKRGNSKVVQPGCEIIVPSKGEKSSMSTAEIMSMTSSTASLGAVIASMVSLFK